MVPVDAESQSLAELMATKISVDRFKSKIDLDEVEKELQGMMSLEDKGKLCLLLNDMETYVKQLADFLEPIRQSTDNTSIEELTWVSEGYEEISTAFFNVEALDKLMDLTLKGLETTPDPSTDSILETVAQVCEYSMSAKRCVYRLKTVASIAIHYKEIGSTILLSIEKEVAACLQEAKRISKCSRLSRNMIDGHPITFAQILGLGSGKERTDNVHDYKGETMTSMTINRSSDLKLPVFDELSADAIKRFSKLIMKVDPLSVAISYIPHELEGFNNVAKSIYPGCVLELVDRYRILIKTFVQLDDEVTQLEEHLIGGRWKYVFESLSLEITDAIQHPDTYNNDYIKSILEYMRRILTEGCITDESYRKDYDALVVRCCEAESARKASHLHSRSSSMSQSEANRKKNFKGGENFINSLAMKPVLIEGEADGTRATATRSNKDFVSMMCASERDKLKRESKLFIDKLMKELRIPVDCGANDRASVERRGSVWISPSASDGSASSVTTPTRGSVRRSQTSPNPFTTPSLRKSRLPTLGSSSRQASYVPLPVHALRSVKAQVVSFEELRRASMSPPHERRTASYPPATNLSKIPVPVRMKSQVSIARADSRRALSGSTNLCEPVDSTPIRRESLGIDRPPPLTRDQSRIVQSRTKSRMGFIRERPQSRLEQMGSRLSTQHGTRSPSNNPSSVHGPGNLGARPRTSLGTFRGSASPSYPTLSSLSMKVRSKQSPPVYANSYRSVSWHDI